MSAFTPPHVLSPVHVHGGGPNACFRCVDLRQLRDALEDACRVVVTDKGRIEIVTDTPGQTVTPGDTDASSGCVIISKAELDDLERALAIYAATEESRAACRTLARLAARTADPPDADPPDAADPAGTTDRTGSAPVAPQPYFRRR